MELAIFINSAGINTNYNNIFDTLSSIKNNINISDYGIYYFCENNNICHFVYKIIKYLDLTNNLIDLQVSNKTWSENYNIFFQKVKEKSKYILISHDDLTINTHNFFNISKNIIENSKEKIGWVTYTNNGYYSQINKPISNSIREGFLKDRHNSPYTFECYKFSSGEEYDNNKIFLPNKPVKCHGPYSHLNLIKTESLRDIEECPEWGPYTLLIDENWCLDSLAKGFVNVWIPSISYTHPLRMKERLFQGLKDEKVVWNKFYEKWNWNFAEGNYSDSYIEYICKKYKNTNIGITKDKFSYEWNYLEKKEEEK